MHAERAQGARTSHLVAVDRAVATRGHVRHLIVVEPFFGHVVVCDVKGACNQTRLIAERGSMKNVSLTKVNVSLSSVSAADPRFGSHRTTLI